MSISYNPARHHDHAQILYKILPAIYRERDQTGDLKKYLNASGLLLDQMHRTLLQRYADIFADADPAFELQSQSWLLPYIAQLLDVKLLSPFEQGQREEISRAIAWRKAKGTVNVIEQVAESVGQLQVVLHEGWKRVAVTARVGVPVLPLNSYGYTGNETYQSDFNAYLSNVDPDNKKPDLAPVWAKHPALPAGTVDFRCPAGAVATEKNNPAAIISRVKNNTYRWRQSSVHGAPSCHSGHSLLAVDERQADWLPGYFDDPSVRTVDFRNGHWRQGHFHPNKVLLFTDPHPGFFAAVTAQRRFSWQPSLFENEDFLALVSIESNESETIFRNKSLDTQAFQPIVIRLKLILGETPLPGQQQLARTWTFCGFVFDHSIEVNHGFLVLQQCAAFSVVFHHPQADALESALPENKQYDLIADDCLFKRIEAVDAYIQLQYCTVLNTSTVLKINASDCIFNGLVRQTMQADSVPGIGCIRFSALHPEQSKGALSIFKSHFKAPVFYSQHFGEAGCGVLHPATDALLQSAAQDASEIGAYHHLYLLAAQQAVIEKLQDFLPAGMKAILIPDPSLLYLPNEIKI